MAMHSVNCILSFNCLGVIHNYARNNNSCNSQFTPPMLFMLCYVFGSYGSWKKKRETVPVCKATTIDATTKSVLCKETDSTDKRD